MNPPDRAGGTPDPRSPRLCSWDLASGRLCHSLRGLQQSDSTDPSEAPHDQPSGHADADPVFFKISVCLKAPLLQLLRQLLLVLSRGVTKRSPELRTDTVSVRTAAAPFLCSTVRSVPRVTPSFARLRHESGEPTRRRSASLCRR